jgi:hypothetical protein
VGHWKARRRGRRRPRARGFGRERWLAERTNVVKRKIGPNDKVAPHGRLWPVSLLQYWAVGLVRVWSDQLEYLTPMRWLASAQGTRCRSGSKEFATSEIVLDIVFQILLHEHHVGR